MFGAVGAVLAAIHQKKTIKSIQSGTTTGAGNVTINTVDTTKTMVLSASKGSAGYVAARGSISLSPTGGYAPVTDGGNNNYHNVGAWPSYSGSITGGATDLTAKVYSARLVNATTIYCDGPTEWQVIEFA